MANTYTQLHLHFVFAVKYRRAIIGSEWKERLHQYITGIIQGNKHKMLQINSMPDHIHIFIGMRPDQSISSLIQNVKTESSRWINSEKLCDHNFAWQEGYGAFSYGKSQTNDVIKYIRKNITGKKRFLANIDACWTFLRLIGMPNTFSGKLNKVMGFVKKMLH